MTRRVTYKNSASGESEQKVYDLQINVFEMIRSLLKARKFILITTMTVVTLFAGYLFMQPNQYRSSATILPSGKSTGGMSALKSLVGFTGSMTGADENSSSLFPVILKSNSIVDAVLARTYSTGQGPERDNVKLAEYYDQNNHDRLRRALRQSLRIKSNKQTGEIAISFETDYPWLSQVVLTEFLTQLEDFNLNKRQSSAHNNALYLEKQLEQNDTELSAAEDDLEAFRMANLNWASTSSPELLKEIGRLERNFQAKSSAYVVLTQQYELAKFEAQKDIPIIRILDHPSLPILKSGPFRRTMIILSFLIAAFLACFLIIVRDLVSDNLTGSHRLEIDLLQKELNVNFPRSYRMIQKVKTTSQR